MELNGPYAVGVAATGRGAQAATSYLGFRLARECYGFDVATVREIRHYQQPTRIATAPPFVKGVLHLHGAIVPVVDLRIRFGCDEVPYGPFTVMVVLQLDERMVAMVVDAVTDVVEVQQEAVRPVPDMQSVIHGSCFTGLVQLPQDMLILVDAARLVQEVDDWLASHEQSHGGVAAPP